MPRQKVTAIPHQTAPRGARIAKSQSSITAASGIRTAVSPNPVKAISQALIVNHPIPLSCNRRVSARPLWRFRFSRRADNFHDLTLQYQKKILFRFLRYETIRLQSMRVARAQLQGRSSPSRAARRSLIRRSTSACQACRSMSLNLAVSRSGPHPAFRCGNQRRDPFPCDRMPLIGRRHCPGARWRRSRRYGGPLQSPMAPASAVIRHRLQFRRRARLRRGGARRLEDRAEGARSHLHLTCRARRLRCRWGAQSVDLPHASALRSNGSDLSRFPVAAKMALPIAGASGGTPGSPMPDGAAVDFIMYTSTLGISRIRAGS